MITLDRLKLVATLDCLLDYDPDLFNTINEDGITKIRKYKTSEPFLLSVEIKEYTNELVIDFTGKILGSNYPKLISQDTIMECFERLNELGVCRVDPAKMMFAEVVRCDVTKDVKIENIPSLTRFANAAIRSHQKFCCRLQNNGLVIEKNVTTNRLRKRLTIYDKEHEMTLARNKKFITNYELDGTHDGICRFEMNLNSKEQIREVLGLSGNTLEEVLHSSKNPIRDFLDDVLDEDQEARGIDNWKSFENYAVLAACDFDLVKVEAKLRQYRNPRSTNIPKTMERYRKILAGISSDTFTWTKEKILDAVM